MRYTEKKSEDIVDEIYILNKLSEKRIKRTSCSNPTKYTNSMQKSTTYIHNTECNDAPEADNEPDSRKTKF